MQTSFAYLDRSREKASSAFDRHCIQWELLQANPAPTDADLIPWLSARDELHAAQAEFEEELRQASR
ncbi:hypothetical protein [Pseudomonas sp. Irchel 3H7]|jgi:hypothetical protein|uniref:hypothetical protein n=1 Tax=Pseudomonas sp. Irchel 3H7 TaxID=2009042 RepID=UPI00113FD613|nr:hypothetical protein [Pseudomonas sp. Irchel 3H7]